MIINNSNTDRGIQDLKAILEHCGAMEKIKEADMLVIFNATLLRLPVLAIEDYRKGMLEVSYELINKINEGK